MENFNLTFPIDLVKKEERIVSGIATADNIDKVGDIVEFQASEEAFANWEGNIREMHAPVAVGKAINYEPVEITGPDGKVYKGIRVDAYISKGAQNTWEKVLDGTLRAFSIGGKIVEKIQTAEKMNNGRPIHRIKKYMLGELSLVDNPANAIAVVDIVKKDSDGLLKYALYDLTEGLVESVIEKTKQPLKDPKGGLTAAGRRHFKQTEGANLKPGVKGPANTPEKMRRKGSFLTRFFTNPSGPMKDEKGRPTRLALSAAAWGEPVPQDRSDAAALAAKGRRLLERYAKIKNKSVDDLLLEDDDNLQKEMEYFNTEDYIELIKDIALDEYLFNETFEDDELDEILKSLKEWFREDWVDISRPKKGGGFEPCGREDADSGKYPKCVPASRAARMSPEEIASAVRRKRRAEATQTREDKKPIYVSTEKMEKRDVSSKERERLASRGAAMPDGSYPIANVQDLKNAIQSFGRAKNPAEVKAHIIRRAKALNAMSELPESWGVSTSMEKANIPTNPELYARVKAEAKAKFDVYPSAYANAWLVREYKKRGGSYRVAKSGEVTSGNMGAGIKNPTQGYFATPIPGKRKKKESKMKKSVEAVPQLVESLQEVLAHNVVLYFSAHRAHWNVQGPDFSEYHDLFGEIYEDTYGSIDPFAENIRKSGGFPNTLSEMEDMAEFEDATSTTDARVLASDLYEKNLEYIEILKEAFNVASSLNEQGIANFIADRIDNHQKWSWQLNASLGGIEEVPVETEEMEDESTSEEEDDSISTNPMTLQDLMNLLGKAIESSTVVAKFEKKN